jgi:hypothetical protein
MLDKILKSISRAAAWTACLCFAAGVILSLAKVFVMLWGAHGLFAYLIVIIFVAFTCNEFLTGD